MNSSKITWIYAGLGLAAGVGLVVALSESAKGEVKPTSVEPLVKPSDRVLLAGDSLAQGLTYPLKQLAGKSGIAFQGDGRVGTTIRQWARNAWLAQDMAAFKPSVVLMSIGTNDMKLLDPMSEAADLEQLAKTVKGFPSKLVFLAPPTMPFGDKGVRGMLDAQGQPTFRSEQLQIPRAPDGIHPTIAGYAGWAGAIWQWLTRPEGMALGQMPARRMLVRKVHRPR